MDKGSNKLKQAMSDTVAGKDVSDEGTSSVIAQASASGAGTRLDDSMPQTCCSTCQTVFEVSPELLASNDTRVRCGECLSIFDALTNLRHNDTADEQENPQTDDSLDSSDIFAQTDMGDIDAHTPDNVSSDSLDDVETLSSGHGNDLAALDLPHTTDQTATEELAGTEYDLFSGKAGLPDVAYFDQTQEVDSLNFDEPDGDETFGDEIFAHDLTMGPTLAISPAVNGDATLDTLALDSSVDFVTDDVERDPVVFNYQDRAPEPEEDTQVSLFPATPDLSHPGGSADTLSTSSRRTWGQWLVRSLLALLVLIIAGGLYGHRYRQVIIQNPEMRPYLDTACSVIGCQLPPLVSLDQLKVLKRSVFSHPTLDNALVIDLAFVNQAQFGQPYPVLEIRLTNLSGGLVVQKDVAPANYLDGWQAGDLIRPGERLDLSLTVEDPGQTASSFELEFR